MDKNGKKKVEVELLTRLLLEWRVDPTGFQIVFPLNPLSKLSFPFLVKVNLKLSLEYNVNPLGYPLKLVCWDMSVVSHTDNTFVWQKIGSWKIFKYDKWKCDLSNESVGKQWKEKVSESFVKFLCRERETLSISGL